MLWITMAAAPRLLSKAVYVMILASRWRNEGWLGWVVSKAEFAQYMVAIGVEIGGARARRRVGETRKLHRVAGKFERTGHRVVDADQHVAGRGLRMSERLRDVVDGAARHPSRLEQRNPMVGALGAQHAFELGPERFLVLISQCVRLEQRILGQVGSAKSL